MPMFIDEYFSAEQNRGSGASDQEKTRKAPGALDSAVVLPPLEV